MDPQRINYVKDQDIENEEVEADDVCEPGKDDEEFNLKEVLRLGGTRVS